MIKGKSLGANYEYFQRPLAIALTLLEGKGVSLAHHGRDVELASYVINFEEVLSLFAVRASPRAS